MKRFIILLMATMVVCSAIHAENFSYTFHNTPISQALIILCQEHKNLNIAFIYKELDSYTTSANIDTDDAYEAIRKIIGLNPISIIHKKGCYYIEALQHGKYSYHGRIIDNDNHPVASASVMLLAPRDSSVITYGFTDENGLFTIPCDKKRVIGKISRIGYALTYRKFNSFDMGDIQITEHPINLNPITVNAPNARLYTDKSVYLPTERQRNAAQSGIMLLGLMSIPHLDVDLSAMAVKTMAGQNVAIFVDYNQATQQDLDGMRTQDVKRVEFYSYPTDPRFKGALYVVNFIMQKYEYGGYTKTKLEKQLCTNRTNGLIYSKTAYKSMMYDIYADETYLTDRHSGCDKMESFHFPDLFENGPKEIMRNSTTESSRYRNNINNIAFRALYSSSHMQTSNRISLNIGNTPVNKISNSLRYSTPMASSEISQQTSSSKNITAGYNGDYLFTLSKKSTLQTEIIYTYGHNTSCSYYLSGNDFSIANNAVENLHDIHLTQRYSFQLNSHNRFMLLGSEIWRHNAIDYSGNSPSVQRYNVQAYFAGIHYDYISQNIQAGGEIIQVWERNKISGTDNDDDFPQIIAYANYMPNPKHLLTISCNYGKDVPDASQKSPNMLQQDELIWFTGSPDLKDYKYLNNTLSYTWLPDNRLQLSATGALYNFYDRCVTIYTPSAPSGTMLRKYVNGGNYHVRMFNLNATAKFLDGQLIVNIIPQYWSYRTSGAYSYSIKDFNGRFQTSYYLKNFYFIGSYTMARKYPVTQAEYRERVPSQYQLQIGWGNGAWNINATAYNFLRKNSLSAEQILNSEYYSYHRYIYSTAARMRFSLSATFTFGYGKKVDHYNEVDKGDFSKSAILR